MAVSSEEKKYLTTLRVKDALFSISVSNLFFIRVWNELIFLYTKSDNRYYMNIAVTPMDYCAAILNVLLLASVIYCGCHVIRNTGNRSIRNVLIIAISLIVSTAIAWTLRVLELIDTNMAISLRSFVQGKIILLLMIFASIVLITYFYLLQRVLIQTVGKAFIVLFIVLSPFCILTFSKGIYFAIFPFQKDEAREQSTFHQSSLDPAQRVVVLLFDETDYRLAFQERPTWLSLPEFDKFIQCSLNADHATSPSSTTLFSIPALLTGKMLSNVKISGANNLLLTYRESGQAVSLRTTSTLFSEVSKIGGSSGVASNNSLYQIVQKNLSLLYYVHSNMTYSHNYLAIALMHKMVSHYFIIFPDISTNFGLLAVYPQIINYSVDLSSNPHMQMVFVHYPYPHSPYVFNIRQNNIQLMGPNHNNYFGNLVLADKTLSEVRTGMEKNDLWDKSMVIITSDHWWRSSQHYDGKEDHRVPFMVKLPGQTSSYVYKKQFNTVIMKDMILAFFNKAFTKASGLASWLDENGRPIEAVIVPR